MAITKTTQSSAIGIHGYVKAGALLDWLAQIPGNAEVSISTTQPDRPWDSVAHTLRASWTATVGDG